MAAAGSPPAAETLAAMLLAMADRKMRPTSCGAATGGVGGGPGWPAQQGTRAAGRAPSGCWQARLLWTGGAHASCCGVLHFFTCRTQLALLARAPSDAACIHTMSWRGGIQATARPAFKQPTPALPSPHLHLAHGVGHSRAQRHHCLVHRRSQEEKLAGGLDVGLVQWVLEDHGAKGNQRWLRGSREQGANG